MNITPSPINPKPAFRVLRDEESPPYDANFETPAPRRAPVVIVDLGVGETILSTLGVSAFGVYWHLCKRANNGRCWPSIDEIAESISLSRRHVIRMLAELEEGGYITRERRQTARKMATSTLYTITVTSNETGSDIVGDMAWASHGPPVTLTSSELERTNKPPLSPKGEVRQSAAPKYTDEFESFWLAYPSGHGVKTKAFAEWKKLSDEDRVRAVAALPEWQRSRKWRDGFVRDCQRWLAYREFEQDAPPSADPIGEPHRNGHEATEHELAAAAIGGTGRWVG